MDIFLCYLSLAARSDVPINRHRQESSFFDGIGIGKDRHWQTLEESALASAIF